MTVNARHLGVPLLTVVIILVMAVPDGAWTCLWKRDREQTLRPVSDGQLVDLARELSGEENSELCVFPQGRLVRAGEQGWVVLTADYATPDGKRGPTSLLLHLSRDGKRIIRARLIESRDTPEYVQQALRKGLVDQLAGREIIPDAVTPVRCDTITGASTTSAAVGCTVNETLKAVQPLLCRP